MDRLARTAEPVTRDLKAVEHSGSSSGPVTFVMKLGAEE